MALSRKDRFNLKTTLVSEWTSDGWDLVQINRLLREFGLTPFEDDMNLPSLDEIIADVSDDVLMELYALVLNLDPEDVRNVVEAAGDESAWKTDYVRVFISHSAKHKQFAGEVAEELALTGIHGFVAHDTMTYDKPWQSQIEQALRSMQAFVAIIHPEFSSSAWCQQEVGWALGRRVPFYVVRYGADPTGFIQRNQWPSATAQTPSQVANIISGWVSSLPELGAPVIEGLFKSLREAGSFIDAGVVAQKIASLGGLTSEQWNRLDATYWSNNQVYWSGSARKHLQPFYGNNGRTYPPTKPYHA